MNQTFSSICPATGETVWQGEAASEAQVMAAVEAAGQAFQDWSMRSFETRVQIAETYAGKIREKVEDIALAISRDMGKALWESRICLLYTSPSPRDGLLSRMPSSA